MAAKKGKKIRERHASDRIFNAAVFILSITTFIVTTAVIAICLSLKNAPRIVFLMCLS